MSKMEPGEDIHTDPLASPGDKRIRIERDKWQSGPAKHELTIEEYQSTASYRDGHDYFQWAPCGYMPCAETDLEDCRDAIGEFLTGEEVAVSTGAIDDE